MSPFVPITLDRDAEVPLGTQLAWVLRSRVTSGQLPAGERLPGARELAAHVGVNVNTVRAVFARLEDEGLLQVLHGKGTFVASDTPPEAAVAELAAAVTSEARRRGIDPRAVAAALYVSPAGEPVDAGDGADRHALREQIAALERQLAKLPSIPPPGDAAAVPPPRPSGAGRLLTTRELEQQRDALTEQVAEAQQRTGEGGSAAAAAAARAADGRGAGDSGPPARDSATPLGGGRRGSVTLRWVPSAR